MIFGAGYGFDHLASASWLNQKDIYYWGDIDTHGFAILNQLRRLFSTRTFASDGSADFAGTSESVGSRRATRERESDSLEHRRS
ncbi:MAG: Wadjet anti-phage system protein JetD domain-containing protein [Saccharofermentanales bacterium]